MQVTREELNPCTVKLSFNLEPDEVKQGFEAAFRQLTKKVRLPGFRPGKAPRAMLTQYVSPEEWSDEAAEEMVRRAFPKALEDEKLEIDRTTAPQISVTTIDQELQKFEFEAKVPLPPKVEVGDYKGLPVEQPDGAVSDDEVDFELNELRKQRQTSVFVTDRGIEEGDVAVLNIKKVGEQGEGKNFMTIAGQTFPQLDQAVMGMKVEEIKSLELTCPETFQQKEWAGQTFQAQVTVNSLSSVRMPELDDSFAQSLKSDNVDALRNRIREAIGGIKQQMVRTIVHERLVDELMGRSKVFVSDNMWENLATRRLGELAREQANKKKTLEEYAKENGMTVEEFAQAWQSKAKLEVERALLVQAVFGQENMEIDNRELNLELLAMAQEYSMSPEDLVEELRKNNALDELHFRTLTRKVGDFLLSNADVSIEKSATE